MAEKNINILDELDELRKKGMLSKKIVILKGPVQDGAPAVEKSEESIIDDEGFKETAISELFYATGCNHLIHTEEELGAICAVCGHLLCRACSTANICSLCGKIVYKKDQKQIEEIGVVCLSCKNEWLVKKVILKKHTYFRVKNEETGNLSLILKRLTKETKSSIVVSVQNDGCQPEDIHE